MSRNPRRLFGFWLPFFGYRRERLSADEAWGLDELPAGDYDVLEFEWFGFGMCFGYRPTRR